MCNVNDEAISKPKMEMLLKTWKEENKCECISYIYIKSGYQNINVYYQLFNKVTMTRKINTFFIIHINHILRICNYGEPTFLWILDNICYHWEHLMLARKYKFFLWIPHITLVKEIINTHWSKRYDDRIIWKKGKWLHKWCFKIKTLIRYL